jgi:hypothetical protein|tara:strand:+ start:38 stop:229 length:192 start_codon:yes stop_codon:yes gene_type:complete
MHITITKEDNTVIETNAIVLARKLNSNVVSKMEDQYMTGWDEAEFINCMIDTIDAMYNEKIMK